MATRLLAVAVQETLDKIIDAFNEMHPADHHFVVQALMADEWFIEMIERARNSENMFGKRPADVG